MQMTGCDVVIHGVSLGMMYTDADEETVRRQQIAVNMADAGRIASFAGLHGEIERLRVENAVLTAQLETLLAPAVPEGWIVTEGPKELLP